LSRQTPDHHRATNRKTSVCSCLGFDEEEIYYHGGTTVAIQAGLLNKTEIAYAHSKMLANVAAAGGKTTLGLALYPPYPNGSFSYGMDPYEYQNAVRKTASFLEFSLCLSRACLGKMIGFIHKWLKNAVFRRATGRGSVSNACLLAEDERPACFPSHSTSRLLVALSSR